MAGKSVARAAWDNRQCRLGMRQSACHLIDRPVATDGSYDVHSLLDTLTGNLHGMSCIFCHADVGIEEGGVKVILDQFDDVFLLMTTRNGVNDECYVFLLTHIPCKIKKFGRIIRRI